MDIGYDYRLLGLLLVLAILIAPIMLILPLLIAPRNQGTKTQDTYECGVDTIGGAWTSFPIAFYLFALIFVAFEVDILYLFPIALVYCDAILQWRDLIKVSMFLLILSLAILFAWRKGVFRWS